MPAFLAQASGGGGSALHNLFETVTAVFSKGDTLAQPDSLVQNLSALSVVWSVVFIIVGVLTLLNGYKFHKVATVAVALLLGLFGGYCIGAMIDAPAFIIGGCLGLLLAVLALPLMKYAVAVFGGLAGAFAGANLWSGIAHAINHASGANTMPPDSFWVGALLGLIICGMLAFVLSKASIVLFTSVSGSTIAVLGVIALLLSFEPWKQTISDSLTASQMVIPLLVFVPAVIGLIMQQNIMPAKAGGGDGKKSE